jgi:transposase
VFIKTTRVRDSEYIKLVESYRQDGKTKHRVLFNFGRADLIRKDESFLRIVKRLCEIAQLPSAETDRKEPDPYEDCGEATLYNYGYLAYAQLWRELGIEDCLRESEKMTYSMSNTVFLMVIAHLLEPMSKLSTYERQNRYLFMPEIPLHHMYRALDKLSEDKEEIETGLFEYNYVRVNKSVDVVFYDLTTVHFESQIADDLRDFGYSKAGKYNEVQVVLGMLIDADGMPVGYELYKGNTFEGKTIVKTLETIKKRFRINRVIIVADRGLNNKINLKHIKDAGYGYIMAAKIKGACAALQKKVLEDEGFASVFDKENDLVFRYKILEHENIFTDENNEQYKLAENMVVTYSPKRAKKDKADRDRLIEKAERLLENPEKIKSTNKRGGRKYINQVDPDKDKSTYALAADRIEQDARFDGYYAIQTSEKSMAAADVMEAYHTLWKIEESFRIMKSTLEIRPVYHWSKTRIEGHFVVCFLAFLMERKMELLLKNAENAGNEKSAKNAENADDQESFGSPDSPASPQKIREALNTMQLAAVTTGSKGEMFIKAKCQPLGAKIFKCVKLEMPGNINVKSDLIAALKLDSRSFPVQMTFL